MQRVASETKSNVITISQLKDENVKNFLINHLGFEPQQNINGEVLDHKGKLVCYERKHTACGASPPIAISDVPIHFLNKLMALYLVNYDNISILDPNETVISLKVLRQFQITFKELFLAGADARALLPWPRDDKRWSSIASHKYCSDHTRNDNPPDLFSFDLYFLFPFLSVSSNTKTMRELYYYKNIVLVPLYQIVWSYSNLKQDINNIFYDFIAKEYGVLLTYAFDESEDWDCSNAISCLLSNPYIDINQIGDDDIFHISSATQFDNNTINLLLAYGADPNLSVDGNYDNEETGKYIDFKRTGAFLYNSVGDDDYEIFKRITLFKSTIDIDFTKTSVYEGTIFSTAYVLQYHAEYCIKFVKQELKAQACQAWLNNQNQSIPDFITKFLDDRTLHSLPSGWKPEWTLAANKHIKEMADEVISHLQEWKQGQPTEANNNQWPDLEKFLAAITEGDKWTVQLGLLQPQIIPEVIIYSDAWNAAIESNQFGILAFLLKQVTFLTTWVNQLPNSEQKTFMSEKLLRLGHNKFKNMLDHALTYNTVDELKNKKQDPDNDAEMENKDEKDQIVYNTTGRIGAVRLLLEHENLVEALSCTQLLQYISQREIDNVFSFFWKALAKKPLELFLETIAFSNTQAEASASQKKLKSSNHCSADAKDNKMTDIENSEPNNKDKAPSKINGLPLSTLPKILQRLMYTKPESLLKAYLKNHLNTERDLLPYVNYLASEMEIPFAQLRDLATFIHINKVRNHPLSDSLMMQNIGFLGGKSLTFFAPDKPQKVREKFNSLRTCIFGTSVSPPSRLRANNTTQSNKKQRIAFNQTAV